MPSLYFAHGKKSLFLQFLFLISTQFSLAFGQEVKDEEEDARPGALGKEYQVTSTYTHQWITFPQIEGKRVGSGLDYSYNPIYGRAVVVVFLASWDRASQRLIAKILELDDKYSKLHTDFIYVFSHDTQKDAENFMEHLKMVDKNSIIANHKVLKTFKEPELVSLYLGDRHNWLTARFLSADDKELVELDKLLSGINAM